MKNDEEGTWVTRVGKVPESICHRKCSLTYLGEQPFSKTFSEKNFRIGGREGADFIVADPRVSGSHCEISLERKGYRLRDLGSTNGTFVGALRLNDGYIKSGTTFSIGDSKIRFDVLSDTVTSSLSPKPNFGPLVGTSPIMRELFARLAKIAATDVTVLLGGETGTGKDLAAEAIHARSKRADGPFAVLDCGSIPPNLIESELFGHVKGAFTGATDHHAGVFERGNKGTVFLDELGELPLELQPKLLRVLENRTVRRVGDSREIPIDIRVLAATNRDLALEVSNGRFREDLYYRLAVVRVVLPPLRERKEDIGPIAAHILKSYPGSESTKLDENTLALLQKYDWPGNVRELRNVLERAALLDEVPASTQTLRAGRPKRGASDASATVDISVPLKKAKRAIVDAFEKAYVTQLLEEHGGNISAAARAACVDRMVIHKIAERFGLRSPK